MRARIINQVVPHERQSTHIASSVNNKPLLNDPTEIIYAVQQPDGEKVILTSFNYIKYIMTLNFFDHNETTLSKDNVGTFLAHFSPHYQIKIYHYAKFTLNLKRLAILLVPI